MTTQLPAPAIDAPSDPASANGRHRGDLQTHDLTVVLGGLEHRLATQPVIEQSKGILMGHLGSIPTPRSMCCGAGRLTPTSR